MSAQTTYTKTHAAAYEGLIADLEPKEVVSKVAEGSDIGFGLVVSRGTSDNEATLGGSAPVGVSVRSLDREGAVTTGAIDYDQYSTMAVMRSGYCWVTVADTGSPGAVLNYNTTTGAIGVGVPGAGEAVLPGTLESTVASGGDLGLVRLNLVPANATSLQGVAVSSTAPTNGQTLTFNSTNNQWEPTT
jgi:hypothetical protein